MTGFFFKFEVIFLNVVCVLDLVLTIIFDLQIEMSISFVVFGAHAGMLALYLITLAHLFMRTFLFQYGLLGPLLKQFKVVWVALLYILIFLISRLQRLMKLMSGEEPQQFHEQDNYQAGYLFFRLGAILFYVYTIQTTFQLSDPDLYRPSKKWQEKLKLQSG